MPTATPTAAPSRAPAPGQYFDVPGVGGGTQWTDQYETTVSLATTMATGTQTPVNGILAFKQTDVVIDWQIEVQIAQNYTTGTSAMTTSPYAPYNAIGPVKLPIQNQYNSVDLESGIDLYIFNLIRPWRQTFMLVNSYTATAGWFVASSATGFLQTALAQPNLVAPAFWGGAVAQTYNILMRLPASITFDFYYDLAITGEPIAPPHAAIVSPQYMAGSTRVITPLVTLNPGNASTLDNGPMNIGAGTGSFTGTATTTFRRKAVYSGSPVLMPPVYAWQYRWRTTRFQLNGVTRRDLQVPLDTGQLLMIYARMFDPSASAGLGAPIQLSTLTRVSLQYGSGLYAFDGTPLEAQADFLEKHGVLLPIGVLCIDLMQDERGNRTNKRALNTLTTSGILLHLEFAAPTSATAYVTMGTESLVYVA
ncbi:MAG TPA: hypothetical protein VGH66_01440 [Acidimicrobiales bacterium]